MALSRPSATAIVTRLRSAVGLAPADPDAPRSRVSPLMRRSIAGVAAATLIAALVVACSGSAPPAPQTARVTRAAVTTGVTSTGSLTSLTQQSLGFGKGGKVTSLGVKVGDRVTAGQVLATIDDYVLRQTLAQQQAQLTAQQAVLNRIVSGTQVSGAQDSLDQSRQILDATQEQADAQQDADESAIDRAEQQLSADENALDQAEDQLDAIESSCDSSGSSSSGGSSSGGSSSGGDTAKALRKLRSGDSSAGGSAQQDLSSLLGSGSSGSGSSGSGSSGSGSSGSGSSGSGSSGTGSSGSTSTSSSTCQQQVAAAETAVANARRQVEASKTALDAAEQKKQVDAAAGQVSTANAQQGVVTAQNTLNSAASDRPFNIDQQRALVANGEALVRSAQRDVDDATLKAPVDGTVSAINGAVGEFLQPSSGVTALAPGSDAAIPGTDSSSAATAATAGGATPSRPGGSSFIVLNDINQLQVVLPFEESDAAQILPNQAVTVGFDAIPELSRNGRVLSVAPAGTAISGVINYYVTVVLDQTDPRLKDGQTARATVVTQQLDNVLSVPNAAVRKQGADSVVTVLGADGEQRTVTFQPGVVGAERTQVLSGLFDGQEVVLPAGR